MVVPSQLPSLRRHGGKLKTGGCQFHATEGVVATVYVVAELSDTIRKKSAMSFSCCKRRWKLRKLLYSHFPTWVCSRLRCPRRSFQSAILLSIATLPIKFALCHADRLTSIPSGSFVRLPPLHRLPQRQPHTRHCQFKKLLQKV